MLVKSMYAYQCAMSSKHLKLPTRIHLGRMGQHSRHEGTSTTVISVIELVLNIWEHGSVVFVKADPSIPQSLGGSVARKGAFLETGYGSH